MSDHLSHSVASIEVWRPEPNESFNPRFFPGGMPLFWRWVALTDDQYFPAMTRERALKKARRYLRDRDRARATREVVDA